MKGSNLRASSPRQQPKELTSWGTIIAAHGRMEGQLCEGQLAGKLQLPACTAHLQTPTCVRCLQLVPARREDRPAAVLSSCICNQVWVAGTASVRQGKSTGGLSLQLRPRQPCQGVHTSRQRPPAPSLT